MRYNAWMLEDKRDHYHNHGSWYSLIKGMKKSAPDIDTILIEDGDIFIYKRHEDNVKMWCLHFTMDNDLRKAFDEGKVGIGEVVQVTP